MKMVRAARITGISNIPDHISPLQNISLEEFVGDIVKMRVVELFVTWVGGNYKMPAEVVIPYLRHYGIRWTGNYFPFRCRNISTLVKPATRPQITPRVSKFTDRNPKENRDREPFHLYITKCLHLCIGCRVDPEQKLLAVCFAVRKLWNQKQKRYRER